jgi:hypothetical protein
MAIAQNFNKITPENMEAISGDPKAISQMMELVRRARELARLAEEHYKKNRILWVNQEISRLHKRHHERPQNNHPKPSWVVTTPRWNDFSKEAAQRVALRLQARLSRIETLSRTCNTNWRSNPSCAVRTYAKTCAKSTPAQEASKSPPPESMKIPRNNA